MAPWSTCFAKLFLIAFILSVVLATPIQTEKALDVVTTQRIFKKIRRKAKRATRKVSKGVKKATKTVSTGVKKASKGVKKAATTVGDGVKKGAKAVGGAVTDAVDAVGDALDVGKETVKQVARKAEAALDKACKELGTSEECKTIGEVAQNAASVANQLRENRMVNFVNRLKSLDEDFKAIADGDVLRAIDVFLDIAPVVFPAAALVPMLDFRQLETLYEFLKCNIDLFSGGKKGDAFKMPGRMEPYMKTVLKCAQAATPVGVILTMATDRKGLASVAKKLQTCVDRVKSDVARQGFKTVTIGASGGGGVGKAAFVEGGAAFDVSSKNPAPVRGYVTTTAAYGVVGGLGGGFTVGFAREPNNNLLGDGQSVSVGGGPFVVSAGVGLDFDSKKKFVRVVFLATAGTSVDIPVEATCSNSKTVQF